ncbi:DUF3413 domain-containing protein [Basfia succiniciproducens]|uniref:DUF3413 domain-containing protein n=1 Tax=Mannheimia succiniciproducens (strain KCTC 0769BP / MBEL55E) TaxID=221988 RepID=Q65R94_MANSM|nr:DUF3413 domain-containing protein [[Mannheimia] succiniciproducens]AAU38516.1 unknown [[Mannheimia] succiniciproducens MBEL55E]
MQFIKNGRQYREATSQKISWGHWFALFNIIWAILFGSRYAFIIDWPSTLWGKLYFFISILGHFSFVVFAGYLLIIFPLSFIIKNERTFRGLSVIVTTICLTLLLIDTEVFSRFNLHLSSVVWNLLVNPEDGELSRDWQIFFAPMPLILLVQMLYSRWSWNKLRSLERQKWMRKVGIFFVTMFVATHLIYAWADAYIYRPITMQKSNFPLSYPMTARTFLEKNGLLDKTEYAQTLEQEGRPEAFNIDYPKHKLAYMPIERKPNILLINISGMRYDSVIESKMPNLTEFAKQSAQFMNHYSTGNNSNLGLTGLFYGLNASYTDSILHNKTESELFKKLQAEHYQMGLFSANNFKDSLFRQALFQKVNLPRIKAGNQSAVKNWLIWLNKAHLDQAWFSYLDLDVLTAVQNADPKSKEEETEIYDNQLGNVDVQLQIVFEQLQERGLLDKTIVIITADHGHAFQLSDKEHIDYFGLDEIQVPMIIRWNALLNEQQSKLTSHVDLVPTLMQNVFKVENPITDYAQGESLINISRKADWILVGNYRWNVIISPNGNQYHIDRKGQYQKYNVDYEKESSLRPPLGLFLEVFTQSRSFMAK